MHTSRAVATDEGLWAGVRGSLGMPSLMHTSEAGQAAAAGQAIGEARAGNGGAADQLKDLSSSTLMAALMGNLQSSDLLTLDSQVCWRRLEALGNAPKFLALCGLLCESCVPSNSPFLSSQALNGCSVMKTCRAAMCCSQWRAGALAGIDVQLRIITLWPKSFATASCTVSQECAFGGKLTDQAEAVGGALANGYSCRSFVPAWQHSTEVGMPPQGPPALAAGEPKPAAAQPAGAGSRPRFRPPSPPPALAGIGRASTSGEEAASPFLSEEPRAAPAVDMPSASATITSGAEAD